MRILIITDSYPPEIRSASHLMQELALAWAKKGNDVWVITSYPRYNLVNPEKKFSRVSKENGVTIVRVKTLPHHKVNFIMRGIAQLALPYLFSGGFRFIQKPDVVYVHIPPLTLGKIAQKAKKTFHAKYILNVHDIFPQNAVDLNILQVKKIPFSRNILKVFFELMERRVYGGADHIAVPSEGHKKFLVEKRKIAVEKISVVYHWTDFHPFETAVATGTYRKKFGISEESFVFLFGGVLGPAQGIDFVLSVAQKIQEKNIVFLFVGDGTEKKSLQEKVKELGLVNILFTDFVSKEEYPSLMKEMNAGLVCLSQKNKTPIFPAKIAPFMAASLPVFALVNKESIQSTLIQEARCGVVMLAEQSEEVARVVITFVEQKEKLKEMGENGRMFAVKNLQSENAAEQFSEIIEKI